MTPIEKLFLYGIILIFVECLLLFLFYKFMSWFIKKFEKEHVVHVNMKEKDWPWEGEI